MFIKRIEIKNFRGFDNTGIKIDFEDNVTGFIGQNGCGKTAILEAINYLFGQEYLQNKLSERDFNCTANDIREDKIILRAYTEKPFFLSQDVLSEYKQSTRVLIPCNGVELTIKRREKAEKILDDPYIINKSIIPIEGQINSDIYDGVISDSERPLTRIQKSLDYYNISYRLKSGEGRNSRLFNYLLSFNPSKLKKFPQAYYLDKHREREISGSYSLMNKVLTDIHWRYKKLQDKESYTDFVASYNNLATVLRRIDNKQILINTINEKIRLITSEDGGYSIDFLETEEPYKSAFLAKYIQSKQLTPANSGSGYHVLLSYVLLSYVTDQERNPIILLIDEPEMHLHSDWQIKLYEDFINQHDIQVIYSTHSEHFISLKNWKSIKHIKNCDIYPKPEIVNEVIYENRGEVATRGDYLDDYARKNLHISTFIEDNLRIFFTNKSILVEGPAEKYALPKLLSLIDCDLSKQSISIIPVWGKGKLKQYQMLCQSYGIDYFTLFDLDDKSGVIQNNESENQSISTNSFNNNVYAFSQSFEISLGKDGFQKVINYVDSLSNIDELSDELKKALDLLKKFIVT